MPLIEKLNWDTRFFEINIGRIKIYEEKSFDPVKFNKEANENFDLIYVFSYQHMLPALKTVKANLELVDIMLTMSMPLTKSNASKTDITFTTKLTEDEIKGCYEIAEQISIVSRFYNEPLIGPEKTKNLYRKWIDNSVSKSFGDEILISKSNDIVTGIHVIKTNHEENAGLCSLIGVKNNYKGLGTGKNLWIQAFTYWNQYKDINRCMVPFSINNSESFNFHLKMGFNKIEEIKYIYHYRKINNIK